MPVISPNSVPGSKRLLDGVSLICIETRNPQLALLAMQHCMRQIEFKECLLLGSPAVTVPAGVQQLAIPPIASVEDYSRFMIQQIGDYFSGQHALVIQWDGFATNPEQWSDEFLDYDYIGAPWLGKPQAVGNGGFSLRSRRLYDALDSLAPTAFHPEDSCICIDHRDALEQQGVKFAPVEVAERFAWEACLPTSPSFGFHAFFNFHKVFTDKELHQYLQGCDASILQSVPGRRLLKNLYHAGMPLSADFLHQHRMTGSWRMRLDAMKLRMLHRR